MEDTCNYGNCKFAQNLFDSPEECPFFIESWWTAENEQKPILIKDCSNKRLFLMIQELYNGQIALQKSQEEQRNENTKMKKAMLEFSKYVSEHNNLIRIEEINQNNNLLEDK